MPPISAASCMQHGAWDVTHVFLAKGVATAALAAGIAILVGCASVPPANIAAFSQGVTTAAAQTDTAFQGITQLTDQAIIDYAAAQDTLNRDNFFKVLDPGSIAIWDDVFSALEKYCQSLILLTSPDLTKDYQDMAVALAKQVQATGETLGQQELVPGSGKEALISTAFVEVGKLLLKAKAQSDARHVLQASDPSIRQVFVTMADAIGASPEEGLRGTVHAHWNQLMGQKSVAFLQAVKRSNSAERRKLATQFASLLDQQQAEDRALSSLRRSLLALADAHHALAEGNNLSVLQAVEIARSELSNTRDVYRSLAGGSGASK